MHILSQVGGTPGKDCGGFCKYCYNKQIDFNNLNSISIGCKYCPPGQIGCDYCHEFIHEIKNGFKPLPQVLSNLMNTLKWYEFLGTLNIDKLQVVTASYADIVFYPELFQLVSSLKSMGVRVNLGYTSGKGIKDESFAEKLITLGADEINFSVFSMDPDMRRKWMGDKTPEQSLKALKLFCENIDVIASTIAIPDVITSEELYKSCSVLEDWGVKALVISRFTNFKDQGLILNNRPILDVDIQPIDEFKEMVDGLANDFSIKVVGSPSYDPVTKIPYILSKKGKLKYLDILPPIKSEATIITSKLSYKPIKKILNALSDKINVVGVEKEIGDLIIAEDLVRIDQSVLKSQVIIPGRALVHEDVASEILSRGGRKISVIRGPGSLFYDAPENKDEDYLLQYELKAFRKLINIINS